MGPVVCRAFAEAGFKVRVLCHRKAVRSPGPNMEIVWGDVTRPETVKKAVEGVDAVDAVVHLAGLVQPLTEQKAELARKVNVGGTRTVVDLLKERRQSIPFVFASSSAVFGPCTDATECLDPARTACNPTSVYGRTKLEAEELIKGSGIDYVILRMTSVPYSKLRLSDFKTHMFTIPLKNRIEFCHPDDAARAMLNAVKRFDTVKGTTQMIGGGPGQQMLYEDMLRVVLGTFGLPLPPSRKFTQEPFPLHWYDTSKSQALLEYQNKTLADYCEDLAGQLPAPLVVLMRRCIGPAFGGLIVRLM